jgi:hypothetical protein
MECEKCPKCLVEVKSNRRTCPLCGQMLEGEGSTHPTYPPYQPVIKQVNLMLRIILFITLVAGLTSLLINILTYVDTWWAGYVILGLIYMWIVIKSTILSRRNVAKKLLTQMITLSLIVIAIEKIRKHQDGLLIMSCIHLRTHHIAISLLIMSKKCVSMITLYLITTVSSFCSDDSILEQRCCSFWPSVYRCGNFRGHHLGLIIFASTATKDELKKRFHF